MATIFDIAEYILDKEGPMTAMKLQKLAYYSHAWHLVWDEEPLFSSDFQAWANGPVSPSLYAQHRGKFKVEAGDLGGDRTALSMEEVETVDAVLGDYACLSGYELSQVTHAERPWLDGRDGLLPGERGHVRITDAALHEHYGGLVEPAAPCSHCV